MIAQVIVRQEARQVDRLFDYLVPAALEGQIGIGSRVIVPFGAGNKQKEAYVFRITKKSQAKRLKSILRLADPGRAFDANMLRLIQWMREKYLCTYMDVLRAVIPAGTSARPAEWIVLTEAGKAAGDEISRMLADQGGAAELNGFCQLFSKDPRRKIKASIENGLAAIEYRDDRTVRDKTVRVAVLAVPPEDAEKAVSLLRRRRAGVQAAMLEILATNEMVSAADLTRFTGGGYGAVSALEKKGLIAVKTVTVSRDPIRRRENLKKTPPTLTAEQNTAYSAVAAALERRAYAGFLLHGVTGSGKTEVYLRLIQKALDLGRKAVVLVPEIALTPQLVAEFCGRFGRRVAVFHSGLSLGEKYDEWKRMRDGGADIVIGARSAVFAPFDDIGVIIVDEEHETTYKSETLPRYQTKEVAQFRAKQYGAALVLASATPQVETYYRARQGEYTLLTMQNRVRGRQLPAVSVVDMRKELEAGNRSIFSRALEREIVQNLENREQTILFLNRRGFSTFVSCRSCGFVAECPNCNITLTYHKFSNTLRCHYCGFTIENYTACPACNSPYIRYFGGGTQKVEEEVRRLFPAASVLRMDVDTTGRQHSHEKILETFRREKTDILIGTQMVAKGLDFSNVTLVGVVSADTMLHIGDFRAGERTFDLLEQVTGRAGRDQKSGRAVIQTYNPDHDAVRLAQAHDYQRFYEKEIALRQALWYPPFAELVSVLFSGESEDLVPRAARFFAKQLNGLEKLGQRVQVLGPVPAYISKIKNKFRWRILIKCVSADGLDGILTDARAAFSENAVYENVAVVIDKNPSSVS